MKFVVVAFCLLGVLTATAGGIDPVEFAQPQQELRYQRLIKELRCLVCQNQTLAESNAPLAKDMRQVIKRMVRNDESDDKVIAFMTERYGDFVLYRPPLGKHTVILWVAPFVVLVLALALLRKIITKHNTP